MTITTRDALINALANNSDRFLLDKASIANATAGALFSLWRATGQPGQGVQPTSAAICTKDTVGAIGFNNQVAPATSYLGWATAQCSNAAVSLEVHDRLAHVGGGALNITTAQTSVAIDLQTLGLPAARLGDANYSDISWWLELYADGGATASTATINVTYDDGSTGNLNGLAVGGTLRTGRIINLNNLVPSAQAGRFIRGINSMTLSASTTATGTCGFTATRMRTLMPLLVANKAEVFDWAALGLPEVVNDSCLMLIQLASTTSTGTVRGGGKIPHG